MCCWSINCGQIADIVLYYSDMIMDLDIEASPATDTLCLWVGHMSKNPEEVFCLCRNRVVVLTSTLGGPTHCPGLYVGSINAAVSILLFFFLDIDGAILSG